jgi:hypothetical protein
MLWNFSFPHVSGGRTDKAQYGVLTSFKCRIWQLDLTDLASLFEVYLTVRGMKKYRNNI